LDGYVFNFSKLGFDFYINGLGLEIPNKQKEKPRLEYFDQHNIQI